MAARKDEFQLFEVLKKVFGYDSFKGNQEAIIRNILANKDTFVIMPTGGGKSLCYQLPAMIKPGTAIIVSPLIALMKNQVDSIRSFGTENDVAHFMNSSLTKQEITQVKQDITDGKTKLLYVAPETITKEENIDFLQGIPISFYAIDEAHCISDWGHDFRPDYQRISDIISTLPKNIPVVSTTATANDKVIEDSFIDSEIADINDLIFSILFLIKIVLNLLKILTNDSIEDVVPFVHSCFG